MLFILPKKAFLLYIHNTGRAFLFGKHFEYGSVDEHDLTFYDPSVKHWSIWKLMQELDQIKIAAANRPPRNFNRLLGAIHLAKDAALAHMPLRKPKKHILIACMPKSGSTFLATSLANIKGLRRVRLIPAWDAREQELCPVRLSRYNYSDYVSQHHIRYSDTTGRFIKQYGIRPIILVRNLADCLASLRDYMRHERAQSPHVYITERQRNLSDEAFETFLARTVLPWYVNFYLSWKNANDALVIDYDDLNKSPVDTLHQIALFANLGINAEECLSALNLTQKKKTRLNVGIIGRGSQLSSAARKAIQELLDFYPEYAEDPLFFKTRESIRP